MNHTKLKLAACGALLLLIGGGCKKDDGQLTITQEPTQATRPVQSTMYPLTINPEGITPKELTIAVGDTVEFRNSDVKSHWPVSNPNPTLENYPEFNPKAAIEPGGIWSFKFTKAGTWKFHDQLNERNTKFQGSVIVK